MEENSRDNVEGMVTATRAFELVAFLRAKLGFASEFLYKCFSQSATP
jgi:hypothetical protein